MTRHYIIRWLSALIIVAMIGAAPADARRKSSSKSSAHSSSRKASKQRSGSRRTVSRPKANVLPEESQQPVVTAPIDPYTSSITTVPEPVIVDPMAQARDAMARNDPAEALGRYLRVLARDPGDLEALSGAGAAGLAVGDADAAINFYVRAEKIAPRDGRIKAGLASALVQKEQPRAALKLFDAAVDLGVPPASIALDRGLAYDLRGDNKRAQQEYALAVRAGPDAEATRRMALSMAMAGDRQGALLILDPLLRRQDIPAWRARAFVLAMTGDSAGAEQAAYAVLPRYQADELRPFLERLPQLKAAEKAAAVHFGHFPEDKVPEVMVASPVIPARPAGPPKSAAVSSATLPVPSIVLSDAQRAQLPPSSPAGRAGSAPPQLDLRDALPASSANGSPAPRTVVTAPIRTDRVQEGAAAPVMPAAMQQKPAAKVEAKADPKADARKIAEDKKAADRKAAAEKLAAEKKAKDREEAKAKSSEPERYWVQIASGAYKPDLDKELTKQKAKWGKQLAGKTAWTIPYKATNRLLIGPFPSSAAAQAYVNDVRKDGYSCFPVTTSAGQKVERLK